MLYVRVFISYSAHASHRIVFVSCNSYTCFLYNDLYEIQSACFIYDSVYLIQFSYHAIPKHAFYVMIIKYGMHAILKILFISCSSHALYAIRFSYHALSTW